VRKKFELFADAFRKAVEEVSLLYNKTEPKLFEKYGWLLTLKPSLALPELSTHMPYARNAWLAHTFSSEQAKQRAFPAYVLLRTTQILRK
jgi:hypothetical protein